jgi:putative phage-type endonuclease
VGPSPVSTDEGSGGAETHPFDPEPATAPAPRRLAKELPLDGSPFNEPPASPAPAEEVDEFADIDEAAIWAEFEEADLKPYVEQVQGIVQHSLTEDPGGHEAFGPTLGTAEFVGQYEDGSPEWHEARTRGIGGSDAASILGIGFTSAYVLWHQKKGIWGPDIPGERMEEIFWWGHEHEPAIANRFLRGHPEYMAHEGGSWRKADAPWMLANPDRLLVDKASGEMSILEIKSSEQGTGWENDRCPAKYVVQLRHYMWVFGLKYGYLCVKIGNSEYLEFRVPADVTQKIVKTAGGRVGPSEFVIEYGDGQYLEQAEINFLNSETPPPMDGNKDIYEYVRRANMSLNRGEEVELPVEVGTALLQSEEALKKAEAANQEARNHVMAHMGCAQFALYNGNRVASRVAKGGAAPYLKIS